MWLIMVIFPVITTVRFITLFVNMYDSRFLALLWQFILIPNRISKFVVIRT